MGFGSLVFGTTPMVSSPLHITATLEHRRRGKTIQSPEVDDDGLTSVGNDDKVCPVVGGAGGGLLEMEDEEPSMFSDDSHGSSSDLAIRKLLQKACVVDNHKEKHVAFGEITTRSYNRVLGDHPCCSMGCPITLGWEYSQCASISVDEYEASRSPRRNRDSLRTSWNERRTMLADVSDREVKHNERRLHRGRSCKRQRNDNRRACAAFFGGQEQPPPETLTQPPEECQAAAPADAGEVQQQHDHAQCT